VTHFSSFASVLAALSVSGHCGSQGTATPQGKPWENITPAGLDLQAASFGGANYGVQDVVVDPSDPTIVYLSTCYQGIWRSGDGGATWAKLNTGANGASIDAGRAWFLRVDATDPSVMYTASGYGPATGIWKSEDGGVSWQQLFTHPNPTEAINAGGDGVTPDLAFLDVDPSDHLHLLASFHDVAWKDLADAGVIESADGGVTWTLHYPQAGMGVAQTVYFLGDRNTWLVVSNSAATGAWRTTDGGATFARIGSFFGAEQLYRAAGGVYYLATAGGVLRSDDGGLTWIAVDGTANLAGIAGDGVRILATRSTPTTAVSTDLLPTVSALETDGVGGWATYGTQALGNGGRRLAVDAQHHVFYSANWRAGVFRLASP
jgi:hypothetical protein